MQKIKIIKYLLLYGLKKKEIDVFVSNFQTSVTIHVQNSGFQKK